MSSDLYRQQRKQYSNIRCESLVVDSTITLGTDPVFQLKKVVIAHEIANPTGVEPIEAGQKGDWRVRAVEAIDDPEFIVSVVGNTITFNVSGNFIFDIDAVTYGCGKAILRLRQIAGSFIGDKEFSTSVDTSTNQTGIMSLHRIVYDVVAGDQFQIQQYSEHDKGDSPGPPDYANAAYGVTYHPDLVPFKTLTGIIQQIA